MSQLSTIYRNKLLRGAFLILFFAVAHIVSATPASALSGSEFQAGKIIDEAVFYNASSMGPVQIQAFLNAKVPVCDTNGQQMYNGSQTRAQWAAANGKPLAPYTCLKDYVENVPTITNGGSDLCKQSIAGGTKTAAQIIYDAAQACGINPQVLIVLLQKEQSLVTDTWPWPNQYRSATGYGCPDTAPCDAEYYGFFNQVYQAAKAFRRYEANPNSYNYKANRNNFINYNPNAACGGTTVFIQNQATASLYIYTPYQPNAAALNNLYGTGDGCSAYGNRNFWRMFSDWFGSTTRINGGIVLDSPVTLSKSVYSQNDTLTASFTIRNSSSTETFAGVFGICARMNGQNYDFGTKPVTLAGGATETVTFSRTIQETGVISAFICSYYEPLGGWVDSFYPYASDIVARRRDALITVNPIISSHLSVTPANPSIGDLTTASFQIVNNSNNPLTIPVIGVAVRDPSGANVGYPGDTNVVVPANGGTYTYSKTRTFTGNPGSYRFFITSFRNGIWDDGYPVAYSGIVRSFSTILYDNPAITTGLQITPQNPVAGQNVTASFTLRNGSNSPVTIPVIGVAVRDPSGANVGYPGDSNVTIPANGTYTYSKTRTFNGSPGNYRFFITSFRNGIWDDGYPMNVPTAPRALTATIMDNPVIISNMTITPSSPTVGQAVTTSFTIQNYSSAPITIPVIGVAVRDPSGANVGYPGDTNVVVPANGSYNYSKTRTFTGSQGNYRFFITSFRNGIWDDGYPFSLSGVSRTSFISIQ